MPSKVNFRNAYRRLLTTSPTFKIVLWLAVASVGAAGIQSVAWLLRLDFDIFSGRGNVVLLSLALGTLLYLMLGDQRPVSEYGLALDASWAKHGIFGLLLGAGFYVGFTLLALAAGAIQIRFPDWSWWHPITVVRVAVAAITVAIVQQIIFSGYLLSLLRRSYGAIGAVILVSLLFAGLTLLSRYHVPAERQIRLGIGIFLVGIVLGLMRLRWGNIMAPAGILAGWLVASRLAVKFEMLAFVYRADSLDWFYCAADPRQGPVLWLLLAATIGACGLLLNRFGERKADESVGGVDVSFKKFMPFTNLKGLTPLDIWLPLLIEARFRVGLIYLPRLAAILIASAFNTVLALPERLLLPWFIRKRPVPDPVFILGVHRSGTTHLHNILALDKQFTAPKNYQVFNSTGFVFTGWLTALLFGPFLAWRRPMDAMALHVFSPQEEEFAIAGLCRMSPYWAITFPKLIDKYDRYVFPDRLPESERRRWKYYYRLFLQKLTFWRRRRPLLKSPYNTGRMAILREMFPRAKFIHIMRHPHAVYRSNMHLADHGNVVFQLQDPQQHDNYRSRFLDNYLAQEEAFYRDKGQLPAKDVAEINFEQLERDPKQAIRRLYSEMALDYTAEFDRRLESYLQSIAGYRKNKFKPLPEEEQRQIDAKMKRFMVKWGYAEAPGRAA